MAVSRNRNGLRPLRHAALSVASAAVLAALAGPAQAQGENVFDELLEKLKDKGVLSDQEYQALKAARDEEITEQRAERRRQALRQAQEVEQKEKTQEAAAKATKFEVDPGVRSMQLFGDVRVRYESRAGETDAAPGIPAAQQTLDRWRYAVRIGIRGELVDAWYYGLRLETSSSSRSTWVTFGGDTNPNGSPSNKTQDTINVGWAYLGWRPTQWLDLTIGRMPNPFFTAGSMVWDPDINPEGLAEKFSIALNDRTTLFGNFAQTVYADTPIDGNNTSNLGFNDADAYLLGYQVGVNYKFKSDMALKAGASYYSYLGNPQGGVAPNLLAGPYTGQPGGNQIGINNLSILDFPIEFSFPLVGKTAKIYGDFAMNLDADQRAQRAGFPNAGNQDKAYLLGFQLGTLKKKHDWEARLYWQRTGQFALDPNLVDSDWFDSRVNEQGWYVAGGYSITDAIYTTLRYGWAKRNDTSLGTGGIGDLALNPLDNYQLLQLDLGWKF
jgi:hypothetical protein